MASKIVNRCVCLNQHAMPLFSTKRRTNAPLELEDNGKDLFLVKDRMLDAT
jgi:hypothetical protein